MPTIRELITRIGWDVDEKGAKKADLLFKGLVGAATALVGVATVAAGGLVSLTKHASDVGDAAAKSKQKLGITAEEVQELGYVAENSGVSFETLASGLKTMNRQQAAAASGNKQAAEKFAQAGLKIRDGGGKLKPTIVLLRELADKVAAIENPSKKAGKAAAALGRGVGAELLPMLNLGGKGIADLQKRAQLLGFVMDEDTTAAAESLNDAFTDLNLIGKGVMLRFGIGLMPVLRRLIGVVVDNDVVIKKITKTSAKLAGMVARGVEWTIKLAKVWDEHRIVLVAFMSAALIPVIAHMWELYKIQVLLHGKVALMSLGYGALAAAIGIAIEDIHFFVTGGQSAIGHLRDAFVKAAQEPGANWMVKVLARILDDTTKAIGAVDELTKKDEFWDFFGLRGIEKAKPAWLMFFAWINKQVDVMVKGFAGLPNKIGEGVLDWMFPNFKTGLQKLIDETVAYAIDKFSKIPGFSSGMKLIASTSGLPGVGGTDSSVSGATVDWFMSGGPSEFMRGARETLDQWQTPATSPLPAGFLRGLTGGGQTITNVNVAPAQVDVSVSGSDLRPGDVGDAARSGVDQANQRAADEIASRFRSR